MLTTLPLYHLGVLVYLAPGLFGLTLFALFDNDMEIMYSKATCD